jgi:hypothetical protein
VPIDVLAEATALVSALRAAGRPVEAAEVDRALYGSTSGEILTDLAACLSRVLEAGLALPPETARRARTLREEARRILRGVGQR